MTYTERKSIGDKIKAVQEKRKILRQRFAQIRYSSVKQDQENCKRIEDDLYFCDTALLGLKRLLTAEHRERKEQMLNLPLEFASPRAVEDTF